MSAVPITRLTADLANNLYSVGSEQRVRDLELTSSGEITPSLARSNSMAPSARGGHGAATD
ncbi:hypothetical protein JMJ55_23205 [Belnapia sp. T6]|uniref:Uncharacterized protein n=1 Tax=Belnapia mucosa TaxID=2804532 RepID=A0ABS1V9B4_9PROT|nr:hypothetical protein [Belnapia mucosa]MBL6458250.1 hypothetical protein [Belnapia mucosa]